MGDPTRVLLVDDHRMFAEALEILVGGTEDIQIAGIVGTGEEAIERYEELRPDVVLMDVDLPGVDGVDATRRLRERHPDVRIVLVTAFQEAEVIARGMAAGALAYLPKTRAADDLKDVIRRAAAGQMVLSADTMGRVLSTLEHGQRRRSEAQRLAESLTSREIQILQALAHGRSVAEIARTLYLSPATVRSHVKNVLSKLDVHSQLEAVTLALRLGLVKPPS